MRQISSRIVTDAIKDSVIRANIELNEDVVNALKHSHEKEESPVGKEILASLLQNAMIAKHENIPICQDTGLVVAFAELGRDVSIVGGDFNKAIDEGVREGYKKGFLRKSVCHPFTRENTRDNTPVIIHVQIVEGDRLTIWLLPKGGGSENMSRLFMLLPAEGWLGIKKRVVRTVIEAGANPCPPTVLGVGIGGNFETAPLLAKKALLRPLGTPNDDPELNQMEEELLAEVNKTGIGPEGLGGRITSLAVHIKMMPCHIASLPVAINIQCHASRCARIEL